jgi:hypothetical protein
MFGMRRKKRVYREAWCRKGEVKRRERSKDEGEALLRPFFPSDRIDTAGTRL